MLQHFLSSKPKSTAGASPDRESSEEQSPDEYDDFFVPEGMEIDHQLADRFKTLAKELNLSQIEAQKLVDFYSNQMSSILDVWMRQHENRVEQWQRQSRNDRELSSGNGFDRNISTANKAVERFGGEKLANALAETGAASHPEVLRCFYRIGKSLSEDGFVAPGGKRQKKSYAETFYPDFNP